MKKLKIKTKSWLLILSAIILLAAIGLLGYKFLFNQAEPEYFLEVSLTGEQALEYQRRIEQNFEQLKLFPNNYTVYVDLGNLETELGHASQAIEYYEKAWEIIPTNATPWLNIGNIYIRLGEYQKAETAFLKAIEVRETYYFGWFNLTKLYKDFYTEKSNKVRAIYLEGLKKTDNDYQLLYHFVDYLMESKNYSEALEYLKVYAGKVPAEEDRQAALKRIEEVERLLN